MNKWIVVFCAMLSSYFMKANQSDLSSITLIEQSEDVWVVKVRASLKAFEYEVKSKYGKDSYKNPEEFQNLVLDHVKQSVNVNFNDLENVDLTSGKVSLGRETSVVFEVLNAPKLVESVKVKNLSFKEIANSKSALMVVKKDFAKEQFLLSGANYHEAELKAGALKFELKPTFNSKASTSYPLLIFGGLIFFSLSAVVYFGEYGSNYHKVNNLSSTADLELKF